MLLRAALNRRYVLLVSVPIVLEYEAVMTREVQLLASGLDIEKMQALLDAIVEVAERVRLPFRWRPATRDPNDDMFLEASVNGGADALVTFNQRDFSGIEGRFGIRILSPKQAWEEICKS